MAKLLLTSIKGYPIIIKCETVGQLEQFKTKGAITISEDTFERNREDWTQEVCADKSFMADLLNQYVSENECWIMKRDAENEVLE